MKISSELFALNGEGISETEKALFLKDFKKVAEEYFEYNGNASVEITTDKEGLLVCVLFTARRVKTLKNPV